MNENWLAEALGDGWLGKTVAGLIVAGVAGIFGWRARGPTEKAALITAVEGAAKNIITTLQAECERTRKECERVTADNVAIREQHAQCETRLDALEDEKAALRRELDALMNGQPVAAYGTAEIAAAEKVGRAAQRRQKK
jgi:hypothetical protein